MRTVGEEEHAPQPTPSPRIAVCGGLPLVRMLNNLFVSPVDRLIFPCPRPSYDDATYPWSASDLIWLRDPYSGHQFPVVVIEPLVRTRATRRGAADAARGAGVGRMRLRSSAGRIRNTARRRERGACAGRHAARARDHLLPRQRVRHRGGVPEFEAVRGARARGLQVARRGEP